MPPGSPDADEANDAAAVVASLSAELGLGAEPRRFTAGSVPVFAVGAEHVVKLFPVGERAFFETEKAALSALDGRLSIPTPRLLDAGERGAWLYVVMTRLHGRPLSAVWPELDVEARRGLMTQIGVGLSELHATPVPAGSPLAIDWPAFMSAQRSSARERQIARKLAAPWVDGIDAFLDRWMPVDDGRRALLHTEVMREHLLVDHASRALRVTGLVDFEPSMLGAPEYELSSVGVFVCGGEPGLLRAVLDASGAAIDDELPMRIMAQALLHRYGNLRWYLERIPAPDDVADLESLARRWFAV